MFVRPKKDPEPRAPAPLPSAPETVSETFRADQPLHAASLATPADTNSPGAEEEFETFTPDALPEDVAEEEEFFSFETTDAAPADDEPPLEIPSEQEVLLEQSAPQESEALREPGVSLAPMEIEGDLLSHLQRAQEEVAPGAEHHEPAIMQAPSIAPEPLSLRGEERTKFSVTPDSAWADAAPALAKAAPEAGDLSAAGSVSGKFPAQDVLSARKRLGRLLLLQKHFQNRSAQAPHSAAGESSGYENPQCDDPVYLHWHGFIQELRARFLRDPSKQQAA